MLVPEKQPKRAKRVFKIEDDWTSLNLGSHLKGPHIVSQQHSRRPKTPYSRCSRSEKKFKASILNWCALNSRGKTIQTPQCMGEGHPLQSTYRIPRLLFFLLFSGQNVLKRCVTGKATTLSRCRHQACMPSQWKSRLQAPAGPRAVNHMLGPSARIQMAPQSGVTTSVSPLLWPALLTWHRTRVPSSRPVKGAQSSSSSLDFPVLSKPSYNHILQHLISFLLKSLQTPIISIDINSNPTTTTTTMATTVYVKNIGAQTDDKEIRDFFSFW